MEIPRPSTEALRCKWLRWSRYDGPGVAHVSMRCWFSASAAMQSWEIRGEVCRVCPHHDPDDGPRTHEVLPDPMYPCPNEDGWCRWPVHPAQPKQCAKESPCEWFSERKDGSHER
jgi:hypothetical protein